MKSLLAAFGAGGVFAVGLGVSGMTQPAKVLSFLNIFGAWDPSLAFVMVGAIGVYATLYRRITLRGAPLFDTRFHLPTRKDLDAKLILGAVIFGVGWGLGGYCPGPGLVSASVGVLPAAMFAVSMAVGMKLEHLVSQQWSRVGAASPR